MKPEKFQVQQEDMMTSMRKRGLPVTSLVQGFLRTPWWRSGYSSTLPVSNNCSLRDWRGKGNTTLTMKAKQFFPLAFVLLIATTACTNTVKDIEINEKNFPDENFRAWILEQEYGKDSVLTAEEIASIDTLEIHFEIKSLKGIEFFPSLVHLCCSDNKLTTLDVSKNTKLTDLLCDYNQLTTLDVSKNTKLEVLWCEYNQLTTLDVSKNTKLTWLYCGYNQMTTLDVSMCTALDNLTCFGNPLTVLDVSKNAKLTWLFCDDCQLTTLDVSGCRELTGLECNRNQLMTLDVSKNTKLVKLECSGNSLEALDLSKNAALEELDCSQNYISGEAMDSLVEGLPTVSGGIMRVVNSSYLSDGNEMTTAQVSAAKTKGWTPYCIVNWQEYAGKDK